MENGSGRIIVVHGAAGGTGKTTIALYLSYLYASKGQPTVLVDLTQYGTVVPWLRIPRGASTGLTGLISALEHGGVTDERVRSALLPAPGMSESLQLVLSSGPAKMDQVRAAEVEAVLKTLAASRTVVVDTGSELTDRVLGALMAAHRVALVVVPQVTAGWQALELLEILRSAYVPRERLGLVFNRIRRGGRYSLTEYEQVLGLPVLGKIPDVKELARASEEGRAPNVRRSRSYMTLLRLLAHELVPVFSAKELRLSWRLSR